MTTESVKNVVYSPFMILTVIIDNNNGRFLIYIWKNLLSPPLLCFSPQFH